MALKWWLWIYVYNVMAINWYEWRGGYNLISNMFKFESRLLNIFIFYFSGLKIPRSRSTEYTRPCVVNLDDQSPDEVEGSFRDPVGVRSGKNPDRNRKSRTLTVVDLHAYPTCHRHGTQCSIASTTSISSSESTSSDISQSSSASSNNGRGYRCATMNSLKKSMSSYEKETNYDLLEKQMPSPGPNGCCHKGDVKIRKSKWTSRFKECKYPSLKMDNPKDKHKLWGCLVVLGSFITHLIIGK